MMKNYLIKYSERMVNLSNYPTRRSLRCVDNIGLVVHHDNKSDLSADKIRTHLICLSTYHKILIQAENLQDALFRFNEYPERKIGIKYKAWEFDDSVSNPIVELCNCQYMNIGNWIECHYYSDDDNLLCILGGCDQPPDECPISKYKNNDFEIKEIGGIWIQKYKQL